MKSLIEFPLSQKEVSEIKSMSLYWNEVRRREDTRPLIDESVMVCGMLNTRILALVQWAVEQREPEPIVERSCKNCRFSIEGTGFCSSAPVDTSFVKKPDWHCSDWEAGK